ncbi:MAG: nicotinate (nicotinamide) nucleotide adenylyltransferase [Nitrospirae bacterium]|nr:nicotinate (nicotinamide) nucleotide adenylyltransferase [Nitrospirota bacterium]OIP58791.1 MAG: nicotinate (nicotinamide) nucleotide adenylyltransferase [Nitrospirae bacterium CG2_30_41_42]
MKVGIFGGAFNPIHYGHLRAAEEVRERLEFDKILFIPSGNPPLKTKDLAEAVHRYKMTRLAIFTNRLFELSDIECRPSGKSYTVKTVEELKKNNPEIEFSFILGIDAFLDIINWWHPGRLFTLTNFVIISRPEFRFVDLHASPYIKINRRILKSLDNAEIETYTIKLKGSRYATLLRLTPIGISATVIRRLIRENKSIKYLLPAEVESYIIANKLYKS